MKRHRLFFVAVMLLVMFAGISCKNDKASAMQEEVYLKFDSVEWHDSATVSPNGITRVDYKCVFPVSGSKALKDSMVRWICEQYGDSMFNVSVNMKALLEKMGRKQITVDKAELAEIVAHRGADDKFPLEYATDIRTNVEYEDSNFVTLSCQTYKYMAGAHGSTVSNAITFSKKDGSRCGWDLLADMDKKEIAGKIKAGLKEYFKITEPNSDSKLREMLMGIDDADYKDNFPLPAYPPYLVKDGVAVLYQQYEIAPYSAGMPKCVIKP